MRPYRILWWGRHGNYGPNYPRNRTVLQCMRDLGWAVTEYQPRISALGHWEARMQNLGPFDAVWVPCFRQRDIPAAARIARRAGVPLIIDPLISAYDKQVFEKRKFAADSWRGRRLLQWERQLFALADMVIADTECHRQYFSDTLACDAERVRVIPVSAEEALFQPASTETASPPEWLFFGTFIGLQGPRFIAEAIQHYQGPAMRLTFLGEGPERQECETICRATQNPAISVGFEDWIPFHSLPERIRRSSGCLGVFGVGDKSRRVIPNKVYQALACAKPVITLRGDAYPPDLLSASHSGMHFVEAGNPAAIAAAMAHLLEQDLRQAGNQAYATYQRYFSNERIRRELEQIRHTLSAQ